jgi:hypothetical protein
MKSLMGAVLLIVDRYIGHCLKEESHFTICTSTAFEDSILTLTVLADCGL